MQIVNVCKTPVQSVCILNTCRIRCDFGVRVLFLDINYLKSEITVLVNQKQKCSTSVISTYYGRNIKKILSHYKLVWACNARVLRIHMLRYYDRNANVLLIHLR